MAVDLGFEIVDIDTHTVGVDEAIARIAQIEYALDHMHDVMSGIVDDIHRQTLAQFESWGVAADTPWDALDESTVRQKAAMGFPDPEQPLVRTGELRASASDGGPYAGVEIGETEAYLAMDWERDGWNIAALHQEGVPWRIVHRRAYTTSKGTHVRATSYMWHLPSRPMWVATDQLMDEGADRIVAHVFNPLA